MFSLRSEALIDLKTNHEIRVKSAEKQFQLKTKSFNERLEKWWHVNCRPLTQQYRWKVTANGRVFTLIQRATSLRVCNTCTTSTVRTASTAFSSGEHLRLLLKVSSTPLINSRFTLLTVNSKFLNCHFLNPTSASSTDSSEFAFLILPLKNNRKTLQSLTYFAKSMSLHTHIVD